jgi:hypothetical protein
VTCRRFNVFQEPTLMIIGRSNVVARIPERR